MRRQMKALLIASALVTSLAAAPMLLAQDSREQEMMGRKGMMGNEGMMGGNGSMMGMMGSMMKMMEQCSHMMQDTPDGSRGPNEQWRKRTPSAPKNNG